jgi:hypothetical protein
MDDKKESIIVSHEGWFLFCPIYWSDDKEHAIAKYDLFWLFDLALQIQQFRNWVLSFFNIEGGFPFNLKQLKQQKVISYHG